MIHLSSRSLNLAFPAGEGAEPVPHDHGFPLRIWEPAMLTPPAEPPTAEHAAMSVGGIAVLLLPVPSPDIPAGVHGLVELVSLRRNLLLRAAGRRG